MDLFIVANRSKMRRLSRRVSEKIGGSAKFGDKRMGHYEDLFWEITESVNRMGIRKEFDAQLEKMRSQDKHKYKDTKDRWDYAYQKVKSEWCDRNGKDAWDDWYPNEGLV